MRVALVFAPYGHVEHLEKTRVENEEFGTFPPLNLAYVASIIRNAGHEVMLLDANALRLSKEQACAKVMEFEPDLIGFMLTTYMFQRTFSWIRHFKHSTGKPIIVGGVNLSLFPEETMGHDEIDYAVLGSGLRAIPQFLDALAEKGSLDIPGIAYKEAGRTVLRGPAGAYNLDSHPFPARDLLPNDRYYSYISQRKNFTAMTTSMGCPYRCVFCDEAQTGYNSRSPESVVNEIEQCVHRYGVREIDFFDREFTIERNRVIQICNRLIRRRIKVTWTCRARVDSVDEELLALMRGAGCRMILYGMESGDPEILRGLNKGITLEDIRKTVTLTKRAGIRVFGFFMLGCPGENRRSAERTIRFARSLALDYYQFTRMSAKPGTVLHKMIEGEMGRDFWREFIRGDTEETRLPMPWTELSQEDIHALIKKAYLTCYMNPGCITRALLNLKSPSEFIRYSRSTINLAASKLHRPSREVFGPRGA